jgi:hypothetical protein
VRRIKPLLLALSILAYSIALLHNFVPHHHHDEHEGKYEQYSNYHNYDATESLTHFFGDITHHPSANHVTHRSQTDSTIKWKVADEVFFVASHRILPGYFKPFDCLVVYQIRYFSQSFFSISLLRGPPVA